MVPPIGVPGRLKALEKKNSEGNAGAVVEVMPGA
jgi:hypothetical protein